ncbi:squamous cell carcinoma antigen recognized by T-cells 3 [Culicoides brevitarsis]|uniref:squamous cell carcinoma antigen recognized by T-cells 3 n=1 Tax=Culicoides brevitarsis TaxID=469753 RepID=UPI00307C7565
MSEEKEDMEVVEIDDDTLSSESEDEEADNQNLLLYLEALQRINENKYSYNDYIQLVDVSFKISDLDKIREAYDLFAAVFPIAPNLWAKRLKIESSLASTEEDLVYVDKLYKKALGDYFCAEIAFEYADFLIKLPNPVNFWNEILYPYALDCMKGSQIFKLWRENVYEELEETPEKPQAICDFFESEIELPLFALDDTFLEFKSFYETHKEQLSTCDWSKIEEKYQKTRKTLQLILPFEKKLNQLDKGSHQDRANLYREYIETCRKSLPTKIVVVLYERMVTDCCLDANVWLDYVTFLQENKDSMEKLRSEHNSVVFRQTPLDVINRSLRNCTWSHLLYIEKMRIMEQNDAKWEDVQTILEEATVAGFQTPEPIVSIWLEYLTYLARKTDFQKDTERENLRRNFQFAWDTLGRDWGALADSQCKILQYWSKLEYGKLGSAVKGRDLWYTVMESSDNSTKASLWIEFAYLELQRGLEAARKIYKKAVSTPNMDDLESLVSSWIQFERCYGSLAQLKSCQEYCLPILAHHRHRKQTKGSRKGDEKPQKGAKNEENRKSDTKTTKRKNQEEENAGNSEDKGKKKLKAAETDDELPCALEHVKLNQDLHKEGDTEIDKSKDHVTVFFSNLNYDITEDRIKASFPELSIKNVNLIKNATGKTRGYGYIELDSELEVEKALALDRKELDGRPVYISKINRDKSERQKFRYATDLEPNKLFVRGLPFEMTQEQVHELFAKYGKLKDVRLVVHKSGKSKGFAYVEFENKNDASNAILKLDQTDLQGFKLQVAISAPPPRAKQETKRREFPVNLGGAKRQVHQGDAKPRISLIPMSVQKKVLGAETQNKPKSNEEFRKMLLNK